MARAHVQTDVATDRAAVPNLHVRNERSHLGDERPSRPYVHGLGELGVGRRGPDLEAPVVEPADASQLGDARDVDDRSGPATRSFMTLTSVWPPARALALSCPPRNPTAAAMVVGRTYSISRRSIGERPYSIGSVLSKITRQEACADDRGRMRDQGLRRTRALHPFPRRAPRLLPRRRAAGEGRRRDVHAGREAPAAQLLPGRVRRRVPRPAGGLPVQGAAGGGDPTDVLAALPTRDRVDRAAARHARRDVPGGRAAPLVQPCAAAEARARSRPRSRVLAVPRRHHPPRDAARRPRGRRPAQLGNLAGDRSAAGLPHARPDGRRGSIRHDGRLRARVDAS